MTPVALKPLFPCQPVPDLEVDTIEAGIWRLADQAPANFTLIVFYRGLHCPTCANYLKDLNAKLDEFTRRGVSVVAVSSDTQERALTTKTKWRLDKLRLGFGLDLLTARQWGLYISHGHGITAMGVEEPELFSEPALYLIRPDGTLYFGTAQTMPFARPHFDDILMGLDFVIAKNYPARGEVSDDEFAAIASAGVPVT